MAYVALPAARMPRNAMLDVSGLSDAITGYGNAMRQNAMDQRNQQRQAQIDQRAEEAHGWARDDQRRQKKQRAIESMAGVAQSIMDSPAELQAQRYQQFRAAIPDFDADMTAAGFDPNNWQQVLPAVVAKVRGYQDPLDREYKQAQINALNQKAEGGVDFAKREAAAKAYGLDPNSDAGRAYILTGRLPREDQQALTATDKKAILEADEMVAVNRGAITALDEASKLSPQAYDGTLASQRAWVANNFVPWATPEAEATSNLDNAVVGNALSQLKAIFGAAPTEGERKILLDLQGSANQPAAVREAIYARARAAAERRLQFNEDRARQLRGGTFYKPQGDGGPQPDPSGVGGAPIRARNPQTNEEIEWNGQQWVPVQ